MIYSEYCKCMVMTISEADACLELRRKFGDLRPELLKKSHEILITEFKKLNTYK